MRVGPDDPQAADVQVLLRAHLAFAHAVTEPGHVHALESDALSDRAVSFFSARTHEGTLTGIGALRTIDEHHAEIKSMHVAVHARGQGVGRAIVDHLLGVARARGCTRVSLETGTNSAFASARALYERVGFVECPPFGDYTVTDYSICMTLEL